MAQIAYRCFERNDKELVSVNGSMVWSEPKTDGAPGDWHEFTGKLALCEAGYHACRNVYDLLFHRQGNIPAIVEIDGEILEAEDGHKLTASKMRILKVLDPHKTWIQLALIAAKLVQPEFVKKYPDDKRPQQAIEAAEAVLAALT